MATYNTPLITTQGLSLLKAEIAGNDSVTFTKIVFSSDDYSQTADSSVQALTALSSLDLTATARSFTDVNGNLKIRGVANNQNTTSAFYIKTYGLYGKNKSGNEMLIAVSTAQNANFVPAYNNKQTNQIAYTFNIAVSSTNNITLSSSTDVDVTQADLAGINNAVNSNASSLTAQQSSYASSLNSAFSANSSNASSYVSSTANSLTSYVSSNVGSMQSQVSSNASNISSNASAITALSNASITYQGKISNFNQGSKQGLYKYFDGTTSSTLTVVQYNDVIIQTRVDTWDANGAAFSDDDYAPKMRLSADGGNSWSAWAELATQYDVQAIDSTATSLANSLAVQNSAISSNVAANSNAIANASNSLASAVSTNSANIATNSGAISSLQSSVATNSSAIASNATNISTNSSAISSLTSAQSSAVSSLAAKAVTYSGFVPVFDDLNNYTTPGIYDMRGSTYDTIHNSYYQGIGITLTVTSGGGAINQTIFSIRSDGRPQTNIRTLQKMGQWSRWYLQPTIDDVNDNAMVFRGNLPSTHMANITQTGIYNLGGIQTDDGPYPIQWGQLVVLSSGGVINQEVHDSSGTLFTRSINSWGIVGWNTNKH